jgi:probable F420-dependent oxidoreductase
MRLSLCLDPGRAWPELLRLARAADAGRWHALYVCDHFMPHDDADRPVPGPMLECWTTLSALAAATDRVRLGSLVLGNTYRHPTVVANMAATLDQVSHGRVVLGLGAGWQRNEHEAYGIRLAPPSERIDAFDEACVVIRRLLDEDSVDIDGRWYQLRGARCEPHPVQPRVPLLIGGSGPRMLRVAATRGDIWHAWVDPDELRSKNRAIDEACHDVGRAPTSLQRATGGTVALLSSAADPPAAEPPDVSGSVDEVVDRLLAYRRAGADEFIVVDDAASTTVGQALDLVSGMDEQVASQVA